MMDTVKSFLQIVMLLIAVVLILSNIYTGATLQKIGIPGIVEFEFGGPTPPPTAPSNTPANPPPDSLRPTTQPGRGNQIAATVTPTKHSSECILTITNSLVSLMNEPSHFGQQLIRVKAGEYAMLDHKVVNFGGLKDEGWFQIEAEGRSGWIADDTWTIYSKTSVCP